MKVGPFSFDAILHTGASTLVYAGVRDGDDLPVVGKVVAAGRRDLTREFLVLDKLAGPGVVAALGVFESTSGSVLVQRRFGTGSLADALRQGPLPIGRALDVGLQLAQVCARIHAARIIHRDIKPANILCDAATGQIALADFGLAAELPVNARALPVGDFVGTPGYVSPEHTGRTSEGCDARSDLYSVGVTLYELLIGALPFVARDLLEVVAAHLSKLPDSPHHRLATIPPIVSGIVMKLLAKAPDQRYQSARGLAADLERCIATLADGRIAPFELGRSDLLRPRFPQQLFGRGDEQRQLQQALAQAATGTPAIVLLSGREGSGRSELVRALVRDVAETSLLAVGGWSVASERPLTGLADALGSLANGLLLLDEDRLSAVRHQFAGRMGQIGRVIVDVAPALADVFGAQPVLAEVVPAAARARLQHGFRCFASALGEAAPFVLALTGYEHADPASQSMVQAILNSATSCAALIVLIAHEPAAFGALRERPGAVSIELGPLPAPAVREWIAATFGLELEQVAELGDVLHAKAGGNPLMLVRLVEHLVELGVIARRDGAYVWSLDDVAAAPAPPTIGALAAQRIAELDGETQRVLAAIACSDEATDVAQLSTMTGAEPAAVARRAAVLAGEGLAVATASCYRVADPVIARTALAALPPDELARMRSRLGQDLLAQLGPEPAGNAALRVALLLSRDTAGLAGADRVRTAEVFVIAGDHVMASSGYDVADALLEAAAGLLDAAARTAHSALAFRIEMARVRTLMMLGRRAEASTRFEALAALELTPSQIGVLYAAWCDSFTIVMDCNRAIEVGLTGLRRLGIDLPAEPPPLRPLAAVRLNQRYLARLSTADHLLRPDATDERTLAAMKVLSTLTIPSVYTGRNGLYIMVTETAISLLLRHGHVRNTSGFLAVHACILHVQRGDYAAARRIYEACDMLETARPSPELVARTAISLHYTLATWFGSWREAAGNVSRAIGLGVEVGDPMFSALCASASLTMLFLTGAPLDRVIAAVDGWGPFLRSDAGSAAHAANVTNIAGKLTRGEPILQDDLDRITSVPVAAGSTRNSPMVNLGLALSVIGHEGQVRAWLDEIRDRFPRINFSQPHRMTLWLLDGLFAAVDARTIPARRAEADRILEVFRMLKRETQTINNDPAIALIEAHLAHADGDFDRAAGLFGRAARDARAKDLTPLVAYACEQRAKLFDEAGFPEDALMYYREAVAAYRRWAHMTKVAALEQAHPALRIRELGRDDARRPAHPHLTSTGSVPVHSIEAAPGDTVNDRLDLVTVLKVSQDISVQLTPSGVVRAVLAGIAQNAGAERAVFVVRAASGVETVYGEVAGGVYQDIDLPVDSYVPLPRSVMRVVRRTGRPLVVADAMNDVGHAADPFVVESRGRSIACIPVRRSAEITGFVVLENRMVAGAFTPQLVRLTQALVGQAAISLDNASLYQNLENRVAERTAALNARTAALNARNAEMRLVLDHVAQGLIVVGRDGRLFAERSAILASWFADGVPETLLGLFGDDQGAAAWFDLVWEQLVDGFLPLDLALNQLPRQLRHADRILAIDWQPILGETGALERMLVMLSDVTEAVRRVEAEREQKQLMAVFEALSEDRHGVVEMLKDASAIVAQIAAGTAGPEVEKRLVHTLKGNTAVFGLSALAARCHEIEDAMELDARGLTDIERRGLAVAWQALHDKLSHFIDLGDDFVQVRRADYDAALAALRRDSHALAHDVELWTLESFRVRFQRIAEQARALAERLGKGPVEVQIEHGGLYAEGEIWGPFWSAFVHVVRNAVDHGFESADERAQLGKGIATLTLRALPGTRPGTLVLELSDDGRGIAWDGLRDRARAMGLAAETRTDLIAAMFHDGVSTRDDASEISGRGVGLGALAAVCREMGCEIIVESTTGRGTTLRFELPAQLARLRRGRPATRERLVINQPS